MSSSSSTAKFKDRFLLASENGFSYDCRFIVGPGKKIIEGHKMFFSLASEVFKAMFYGDLKEDNVVKIKDLDADGFEAMKYFIYTGEVNFSSTIQALLTYIAARKYLITALTKQCIVYIEKNIKPSEVLEVYEYCEENNIPGFDDLCLRMIEEETHRIVESDSFPMAKIETIQLILKSRRLTLESEIHVFKLFEKWALAKAAQENISDEEVATSFESLKKYIRFLKISKNDFTSHIEQSLLLTQKEKQAIQSNLLEFDSKPLPESLSVVQHQRTFLPMFGVESEEYKYTINFVYSVDQSCDEGDIKNFSIPSRSVDKFEFNLTQGGENFLCFFVQPAVYPSFYTKPIFIMNSKVSVLAQDESDDLIFINECRIMPFDRGFKVLFAEIDLDELKDNLFLRRDNKEVIMIQVKFNLARKK